MYRAWAPGSTAQLGGPGSGGLYQTGGRFRLDGWSADEWGKFFESAAGAASQVYGTITQRPIAQPPVPIVATPVGGVPAWAIVGGLGLVAVLLLRPRGGR